MTPFALDILMHYYVSPEEHPRVTDLNPTALQEVGAFLVQGMLCPRMGARGKGEATFQTTERAEVWIKHVLLLPLPVWKMPE